jgi:hypothetical protein
MNMVRRCLYAWRLSQLRRQRPRTLRFLVMCIGAALTISSGAYANGGTYHHAEFVPLKSLAATAQPAVVARHVNVAAVKGRWAIEHQ